MRWLFAAALAAMMLFWPRLAAAEETSSPPQGTFAVAEGTGLSLEDVLALARERAPSLLAARARIAEAHARLMGASVRLRDNPELETGMGRRTVEGRDFVETDLGLSQTFELGGRRRARIDAAQAGVDRVSAASLDTARRLLRDVAVAFYEAISAQEQVRLAAAAESMAEEGLRIARSRLDAGDAPELDVNLARAALARSRGDRHAAEATREAALGGLRLLLGLDADRPIRLAGDLRDRRRFELDPLLAAGLLRADLRALEAEVREAEADQRLGGGLRWPDLGLGARYAREEDADVVLGTLKLTLPVFERGQGLRADSSARARRLRLELDAGKQIVRAEIRTAFEVYRRRVAAAEEVEGDVLALLDLNESMAGRAYEEGQIGFGEFLLVRREILDTRAEHLARLLEVAIAGVELQAAAGSLD